MWVTREFFREFEKCGWWWLIIWWPGIFYAVLFDIMNILYSLYIKIRNLRVAGKASD